MRTVTAENYFVFDGQDSRNFDALVFERDTFSTPTKEYSVSSIPGRSGDFILPNRRFPNINHVYDVIIYRNFEQNYRDLRNFLLSRAGYCRLEDSLRPEEFYQAYFKESIKPTMTRERDIGKFQLTFTRKPQRWLKSGEEEIVLRSNGSTVKNSVTNPTKFPCYPLYKLSGSTLSNGTRIYANGTMIELEAYTGTGQNLLNSGILNIDLESLQAYIGSTYYNTAIKYSIPNDSNRAFMLSPGNNSYTFYSSDADNMQYLSVTPRWYEI